MNEEQGFQVRDKRSSMQTDPSDVSDPASNRQEPSSPSHETTQADRSERALPPVTFTSFILSLATSGLMQLGQETESGKQSADLAMARQTIDLLALLQEKTKGNLTSEENASLAQVLYTLRMMFVEVEKKRLAG